MYEFVFLVKRSRNGTIFGTTAENVRTCQQEGQALKNPERVLPNRSNGILTEKSC